MTGRDALCASSEQRSWQARTEDEANDRFVTSGPGKTSPG
jgi:hypothetical protein